MVGKAGLDKALNMKGTYAQQRLDSKVIDRIHTFNAIPESDEDKSDAGSIDEPNTYRPPTSLAQLSMAEVMETNTGLALAKIWSSLSAIFCSPAGIVGVILLSIVVSEGTVRAL